MNRGPKESGTNSESASAGTPSQPALEYCEPCLAEDGSLSSEIKLALSSTRESLAHLGRNRQSKHSQERSCCVIPRVPFSMVKKAPKTIKTRCGKDCLGLVPPQSRHFAPKIADSSLSFGHASILQGGNCVSNLALLGCGQSGGRQAHPQKTAGSSRPP